MKTLKLTVEIFTEMKDVPEYDQVVIVWYKDVKGCMYPQLARYKGGYSYYYFGTNEEVLAPFIGWSNSEINNYEIDGK
jgi:hypothetical protein